MSIHYNYDPNQGSANYSLRPNLGSHLPRKQVSGGTQLCPLLLTVTPFGQWGEMVVAPAHVAGDGEAVVGALLGHAKGSRSGSGRSDCPQSQKYLLPGPLRKSLRLLT